MAKYKPGGIRAQIRAELPPRLIRLRGLKGVSQGTAAAELGWSQPKLCRFEKGSTIPDIGDLCRIAVYYSTTMDELLGPVIRQHKK